MLQEREVATQANEFIIERTFNAPRKLVWKAFTEASALAQWWGPKGFDIVVKKLELVPNGTFLYNMKTPDGSLVWAKFVYREIEEPKRIVFINAFSDEHGGITRNPWMAEWPLEILNTLTLTENDDKTTLRLVGSPINATEGENANFINGFKGMNQGFKGTFDQLDDYLSKF